VATIKQNYGAFVRKLPVSAKSKNILIRYWDLSLLGLILVLSIIFTIFMAASSSDGWGAIIGLAYIIPLLYIVWCIVLLKMLLTEEGRVVRISVLVILYLLLVGKENPIESFKAAISTIGGLS
jgi:hypothetical protein